MGRPEVGEENVRKIQTTGRDGGSYMITLPKGEVKKLGWRKDQKVVVELAGKKLVIKDWSE